MPLLTKEQQKTAFSLIRNVILSRLFSKDFVLQDEHKELNQASGAFVTLHKKGLLRGCIGHMQSEKPLYTTLMELAISSAFEDRRFPPLSPGEYDDIDIEISILSPMQPASLDEIMIPKHGVLLSKGFYRSVFLPQVAIEQNWNKQIFMEHLCRKAGLSSYAYKDPDCSFHIFTAEIYKEDSDLQ